MSEDEYTARLSALAAELRAEKAAKSLTYDELAQKSEMQKMTVHRYLSGDRDIPMRKLMALCTALGVSIGVLIDRAEDRYRQQ